MSKTSDLIGRRFGKLTVLAKTGEQEDRYWTWQCRCDCGKEIIVNTKRLTRGTITDCGCGKRLQISPGPIPEDLTGRRYGKLTVTHLAKQLESGKTSWFCQCDCGNQCVVTAYSLHYSKRKSCGCLHREAETGNTVDLTGRIFGRLTVLESVKPPGKEGTILWRCRCTCGTEIRVSGDSLTGGLYHSCGCIRQERQENLHDTMTYVENTCLEVLEHRKSRSDNTSGFRGVSKGPDGKWMVTIGMQNKRYYIGLFRDFDDAVRARLRIEEALHDGFVEAYQTWQIHAEADKFWADENPFYFNVAKNGHDFCIDTVFGSSTIRAI
ncbi:MAG: transcriptional regulator [Clostridia bacterium]|nr:transcriptional regulator [Clostridia bacterium]